MRAGYWVPSVGPPGEVSMGAVYWGGRIPQEMYLTAG